MQTITKLGLAVILFMATAVSNHAQAQTKEETIEWIKEKLNNSTGIRFGTGLGTSDLAVKSIDECSIVMTCNRKFSNGTFVYDIILPTKGENISRHMEKSLINLKLLKKC